MSNSSKSAGFETYRFDERYTFEEPIQSSAVDLVERFHKVGSAFCISEKTEVNPSHPQLLNQPLIASGGSDTYPFISDWRERIRGAFLIDVDGKRIVYGRDAMFLHKMRDSFTWRMQAKDRFLVSISMRQLVNSFLECDYTLLQDEGKTGFENLPEALRKFYPPEAINGAEKKTFTDYGKESIAPHLRYFVPIQRGELDDLFLAAKA